MSPIQIKRLRGRMGITQENLAQLLGVSHITVSRWENREESPPNTWCLCLLAAFALAEDKSPGIGSTAIVTLSTSGIGSALYRLLDAAYGNPR